MFYRRLRLWYIAKGASVSMRGRNRWGGRRKEGRKERLIPEGTCSLAQRKTYCMRINSVLDEESKVVSAHPM